MAFTAERHWLRKRHQNTRRAARLLSLAMHQIEGRPDGEHWMQFWYAPKRTCGPWRAVGGGFKLICAMVARGVVV